MQLIGELKEKVEKAESAEEAKKILEDAGITLDDTELDQVAGGAYGMFSQTPHIMQRILPLQ